MEKENISVEKELLEEKMLEVEIELETVKIELENSKNNQGPADTVVKSGGQYFRGYCCIMYNILTRSFVHRRFEDR